MSIFITNSAFATKNLGKKIARALVANHDGSALVIALYGDLGSGKTTLTQGIADGLGIKDRITSPTFVLMKKFSNLYHIDCYRLQKPTDILGLGWQEIMENPKNIVVVEWPERIKKFLPKKTISVRFKFISLNQRKVTMV